MLLVLIVSLFVQLGCSQVPASRPLLSPTQQKVQSIVSTFLSDIDKKQYSSARSLMSGGVKNIVSSNTGVKSSYTSLVHATGWMYDSIDIRKKGQRAIARCHYKSAKGQEYSTNFTCDLYSGKWMIVDIIEPVVPSTFSSASVH